MTFFVVVLAFAIIMILRGMTRDHMISPEDLTPDQAHLIQVVRAEDMIRQAGISKQGCLFVAVEDDGTSRNGLAEYLVETITPTDLVNRVVVVEVKVNNDLTRSKELGIAFVK